MVRQPTTRAIPPLLKDLNLRTVLETIWAGAPISRAEVARRGDRPVASGGWPADLRNPAVVGAPGVAGSDGTTHLTHFASLEGRPLGPELRELLGLPVTLDNDINLAALGEHSFGVAQG